MKLVLLMKKAGFTTLLVLFITSCEGQQAREEKYSNGNLKEKFSVIETENGSFLKHGAYKAWHSNGSIKLQGSYSKGKRTGLWHAWHQNGQKESDANFKDELLQGAFVSYFPNGKKSTEGSFFQGKQVGAWSAWSNNGILTRKNIFNDKNQLHGLQQGWSENGNRMFEENYSTGKRDGLCKQWNDEGKLCVNATFKDGSIEGLPATFKTSKDEVLEFLSSTNYRLKFLSNMDNYYKWEWKEISGEYSFEQTNSDGLLINFGNDYLYKVTLDKITNDTIESKRFVFIRQ